MKKIALQNGLCAARNKCANVDKERCDVFPKDNTDYVECGYFKLRRKGKK